MTVSCLSVARQAINSYLLQALAHLPKVSKEVRTVP